MIPTKRALIGWSYEPGDHDKPKVGKVIVIEQDQTKPASYLGPPEWQAADFTHGACDADWLRPGDPLQMPEGVFADMLTGEGFASPQRARQALEAFARIEGCQWACIMLAAVD